MRDLSPQLLLLLSFAALAVGAVTVIVAILVLRTVV
jgi:hypothetical protein